MNRETRNERNEMKHAAEKIIVDKELRDRGKDNLEKASYNMQVMEDSVDQQINMKKDLLAQLRERRNNPNQSKVEQSFNNEELKSKLRAAQRFSKKELDLVEIERVNTIDIDREDFDTVEYNREFAKLNNIDLSTPFLSLYSKTEQVRVASEVIDKFELLKLDDMDYMFATAAGLIAGFVDVIYVGTIAKGKDAKGLQKYVDTKVDDLVRNYGLKEKIAMLEESKKKANSQEGIDKINDTIKAYKTGERNFDKKSAIRLLEKNHKVGYDAAKSSFIEGMSPDNHHLLSIGHEPSILGLVVSIYNQLSGTATYMNKSGDIVTTIAENANKELSGNLPNQIIQATNNWFGHLMSDVAGSQSSKGRGSGLPVPGWSSLQKLQFGKVPLNGKEMNIAQVSEWMFKNGYDVRSFAAESIPVVIFETLIRSYWLYKQYFYYGKEFKESLPIANSRELSRLLLVGSATFSSIDIGHGLVKSTMKGGVQPQGIATFVMTVNKPGLLDLGFRSYQNVRFELQHRKHVEKVIETDILLEYKRVTATNDIF